MPIWTSRGEALEGDVLPGATAPLIKLTIPADLFDSIADFFDSMSSALICPQFALASVNCALISLMSLASMPIAYF